MPEFKPPITLEELKQIQQAHGDDPTVKRLLWEIFRLQSYPLRMHQIAQMGSPSPKGTGLQQIIWALSNSLANEPVVQERVKLEQDLFGQQTKPGDDDED